MVDPCPHEPDSQIPYRHTFTERESFTVPKKTTSLRGERCIRIYGTLLLSPSAARIFDKSDKNIKPRHFNNFTFSFSAIRFYLEVSKIGTTLNI